MIEEPESKEEKDFDDIAADISEAGNVGDFAGYAEDDTIPTAIASDVVAEHKVANTICPPLPEIKRKTTADKVCKFHQTGPRDMDTFKDHLWAYVCAEANKSDNVLKVFQEAESREAFLKEFKQNVDDAQDVVSLAQLSMNVRFEFGHFVVINCKHTVLRDALRDWCKEKGVIRGVLLRSLTNKNDIIRVGVQPHIAFDFTPYIKSTMEHGNRGRKYENRAKPIQKAALIEARNEVEGIADPISEIKSAQDCRERMKQQTERLREWRQEIHEMARSHDPRVYADAASASGSASSGSATSHANMQEQQEQQPQSSTSASHSRDRSRSPSRDESTSRSRSRSRSRVKQEGDVWNDENRYYFADTVGSRTDGSYGDEYSGSQSNSSLNNA